MITQKELDEMREFADSFIFSTSERRALSNCILRLLDELERINRLGTEVREVNLKFTDGTEEKIWPRREVK